MEKSQGNQPSRDALASAVAPQSIPADSADSPSQDKLLGTTLVAPQHKEKSMAVQATSVFLSSALPNLLVSPSEARISQLINSVNNSVSEGPSPSASISAPLGTFTTSQQTVSLLLGLPPEILLIILTHLLTSSEDGKIDINRYWTTKETKSFRCHPHLLSAALARRPMHYADSGPPILGIAGTCKTLNSLALKPYFKENTFNFASCASVWDYLTRIGPANREFITKINLFFKFDCAVQDTIDLLAQCIKLRHLTIRVSCLSMGNYRAASQSKIDCDRNLLKANGMEAFRRLRGIQTVEVIVDSEQCLEMGSCLNDAHVKGLEEILMSELPLPKSTTGRKRPKAVVLVNNTACGH
ncbi:hypothetical protein BJ875DRAFT_520424 [Amylocarpus encephaloides]|uniref:Uncharacterized protein n=1 Tax=Amylocarpus encephaloides TaxID=45428 RepID=A0A9P8C1W1_9HELO|nr:hypothetical protein BJ875DRAFT_520424 [Amylocarpus encephaloides]